MVRLAPARAGDDPALHARCQRQTVQQRGIALTHGGLVHQRTVGAVLDQIGIVLLVGVVIGDVSAEPSVDGLQLGVVRFAVDLQEIQQLFRRFIGFGLLGRCGEIGEGDGHAEGIAVIVRRIGHIPVLGTHVVAAGGIVRDVAKDLRQQLLRHQMAHILQKLPPL